jgi:hypothetical protein
MLYPLYLQLFVSFPLALLLSFFFFFCFYMELSFSKSLLSYIVCMLSMEKLRIRVLHIYQVLQ